MDQNNTNEISSFLQNEPEFSVFRGNYLHEGNSAFTTIEPTILTDLLMHSAKRIGAHQTVENLYRILTAKEISGFEILAINGITVENPINITQNIRLIPFKDIPDSAHKARCNPLQMSAGFTLPFLPADYFTQRIYQEISNGRPMPTTQAALICPKNSRPVFIPKDIGNKTNIEEIETNQQTLLDIFQCLTLIGPCSPTVAAFWYQADEWVSSLFCANTSSASISYDLTNHTENMVTPEMGIKLGVIAQNFLELKKETRQKLYIPIERLNRARRRKAPVDKSIELGVAMESIFFDDDDTPGELTFKLKLRAAWLLGKTHEERSNIMRLFGLLYKYRSKAVHNGKFTSKDNFNIEKFEEGSKLLAQAIEHIILEKKWPNWTQLILGDN